MLFISSAHFAIFTSRLRKKLHIDPWSWVIETEKLLRAFVDLQG